MGKDLIRFPRVLSESYNSNLLERLHSSGGSVMLDIIIYLSSFHMKDLFGASWFSIDDFCNRMGYNRTNLQRKLSTKQLTDIFGKNLPKHYVSDISGEKVQHKIETVFEAAIYKLGLENLNYPVKDGDKTSYRFVQIITQFDILTNFNTNKSTKRLYSATLSPLIKDFIFSIYNLLELQDYKKLPSKYRYFYLEISKMIYLIKHKIQKHEAPFYVLTVDQLAKKFDIEIQEPRYRKKKVKEILDKMNKYLKYTNFSFSFIKGNNDKWAYTVMFSFPQGILEYFDEGQHAVVTKKFYKDLLWLYAEINNPDIPVGNRVEKVQEIEEDKNLYNEFLLWANSSEDIDKKKDLYITDFVQVFGRMPVGYNGKQGELENTNTVPKPADFINLKTDGFQSKDNPAV